jgi:agmatinase
MSDADQVPLNFLGLPAAASAYDRARLVVLPIGFEATTSYGPGTRAGPEAILLASRQVETYDADLDLDLAEQPIHTADPVAPDLSSPAAMTDRIERVASRLQADSKWVLALGGEHSVTLGLVRAAAKHARRPLSILQLDAHLDLRADWEGTPYSHACVMRRCVEEKKEGVHVGIRNASRQEVEFARRERLPIFWARACAASEQWIGEAVAALQDPVYLSLDVDGLDPGIIRTTGTPEPGGLGWWPAMRLLEEVFARRAVVAADVVEHAAGGDLASDFAAARLAAKVAALALHHKRF